MEVFLQLHKCTVSTDAYVSLKAKFCQFLGLTLYMTEKTKHGINLYYSKISYRNTYLDLNLIFFSTRKLKILLFPNAFINDAELLTSNCFYIHEQRAWIMSRLHDYLSMGFEILVFHLFYSL